MSNAGNRKNGTAFAGASVLTPQATCPISTGDVGFWTNNSSVPQLRLTGGTDVDLSTAGIPSQTSNAGKFLTTNGTAASWATIPSPGNFAFSGNSVDLSASATMTIGGANTTDLSLKVGSNLLLEGNSSQNTLYDTTGVWSLITTNAQTVIRGAAASDNTITLSANGIGGAGKLGFFGATPIVKQATPASTTAGIIALLQAYGLCT